ARPAPRSGAGVRRQRQERSRPGLGGRGTGEISTVRAAPGVHLPLRPPHARSRGAAPHPPLALPLPPGPPTPHLEAQLAALPPHAIVYYLLVYQDGAGNNFQPLDY